jgi:RNA polymerase sigma-70 factor (ECF subfamily)
VDREGRSAARELPLADPDALGALLAELEPRLLAVALRLTRDRDVAQDMVQAAFEKAIRHGHRFRGDSRVSTWLHRIVANESLMWLRSHGRRAQRTRPLEGADELTLTDPGPDALESLDRRQRAARVQNALGALPCEERDVLLACGLHGRSYHDYGRERGIHPAALKSRAFRARRRLGSLLAESASCGERLG